MPADVASPRFGEVVAVGPHGLSRVSYVEWGPEVAERTVLCVHGLTRVSRDFDFLAMRLAHPPDACSSEKRLARRTAATRSGGCSIGPASRSAATSTAIVPPLMKAINSDPPSSTSSTAERNAASAIG